VSDPRLNKSPFVLTGCVVGFLALVCVAGAQVPGSLKHAIPAPPVGVQAGGWLGFAVAIEDGLAAVGAPLDDTGALNSGAVKVFDPASGTLLRVLYNPIPAAAEQFGWAVAVSGTRIVVGTPNAPPYGPGTMNAGSGRVHLYDLAGATPTVPLLTLENPYPGLFDEFGYSVAISGTRVVVGAHSDDTGTANAGSAYVYDIASDVPTVPIATLNNPDPTAKDHFAYSVDIDGTRVVVGAPGPGDNTGPGTAYVYDLSSATPTVPLATLDNPEPGEGERFGIAVTIAGPRVVIGAPGDNTAAGTAFVYDLSSATPTVPLATLHNPEPRAGELFGSAVAISEARVVVGAHSDDTSAEAFVYDLSTATPTDPVATLRNPGQPVPSFFGRSVAISGTRVVSGAPLDDTGASHTGSAYLYEISSDTPTVPVAKLHSPGPSGGDLFGDLVAVSGTHVAVGAYTNGLDNPAAIDSGSVYVYNLMSGTPTLPVATLNNPKTAMGDMFGDSMAISGTRVVVGAAKHDMGLIDVGIAYVYDFTSAIPTVPVLELNNPSPASQDEFGNSIAISGATGSCRGLEGQNRGLRGG
jgi:FG-GAP repeat